MSVYFFKQKSGLCNQNIYVFEKYLSSRYLEIYKCAAQCVGWLAHSKLCSDLHSGTD